jgi:hypothetical protein
MINLRKFKAILDNNFPGMVSTRWIRKYHDTILEVKIGRLDIWIDKNINFIAFGAFTAEDTNEKV